MHKSNSDYRVPRLGRSGRILIPLIVLVVVSVVGFLGWRRFAGGSSTGLDEIPLTVAVTRGPFDHVVLDHGEIESSSNIDVVNEVKSRGTGGMTILWVVPEGTYVKKGDKLIELDSSGLQDELTAQRIKVLGAEALVSSSEATVSTNEIALQEYMEGTYQSERKSLLSEIDVAQQQLRKSVLNLDSARRLAAKGLLKGLQIEAEEFSVSNAQNVLESARGRLKVLDELTLEKNRVQLTRNIESAKAKLSADQSVLAEEQNKLAEIQSLIQKCIILSPADGIVVYNNERSRGSSSEFMVKEGSIVRERQTIIKLPDPSKMQVKALVNESRIVRIAPGMVAKVRVSAYPDEMLARVKRVNKYAEPGSWFSSSVKEYAAYLEIVDPPEAIRSGMSAEVRIFVEQIPDALQVPVHGVYEYRGHIFCLVQQDAKQWETREVKIGATNEKFVTITEGLKEGEKVVLNPRNFVNLMQLPELEDVQSREALAKLAAERPAETPVTEGDPRAAGRARDAETGPRGRRGGDGSRMSGPPGAGGGELAGPSSAELRSQAGQSGGSGPGGTGRRNGGGGGGGGDNGAIQRGASSVESK